MNFLHYFQPNPVLAQIGPLTVRWYGLFLAIAFLAAIIIVSRLAKKQNLRVDDVLDLAFWLIIGGLAGARLYDVLVVDWSYFAVHPVEIFYLWQGGLAIHGAIIGGIITLGLWCQYKRQNFWLWLDLMAMVLPLAQAIGRWGNYFNAELFGRPTAWPWGIPIPEKLRPLTYQSYQYFQPAFLYESMLDFLLFLLLFLFFKKGRLKIGQLSGFYLIGYGLIRFIMEFVRIDVTLELFWLRVPQIASIFAVIIGLVIIRVRAK